MATETLQRNTVLRVQNALNKCDMAYLGQLLFHVSYQDRPFEDQIYMAMSPEFDKGRLSYNQSKEELKKALRGEE